MSTIMDIGHLSIQRIFLLGNEEDKKEVKRDVTGQDFPNLLKSGTTFEFYNFLCTTQDPPFKPYLERKNGVFPPKIPK
jgi:hypothetical protein